MTWVEASESCWKNHQQAHLAEIKNEEEKDFLRCLIIICISLVFPLSNGASAKGRQDLKMSLSFRKMSYQSNISIFVSCIVQILQSFLTTGPWSVSSQMTQFMVGGQEQPTSTGIFLHSQCFRLLKIGLGVVCIRTCPSTFYLKPWHISLLLLSSLFPI